MDYKDMQEADAREGDVLVDSVGDPAKVIEIYDKRVKLQIGGTSEEDYWPWLARPVRLIWRDGKFYEPVSDVAVEQAIESIKKTARGGRA